MAEVIESSFNCALFSLSTISEILRQWKPDIRWSGNTSVAENKCHSPAVYHQYLAVEVYQQYDSSAAESEDIAAASEDGEEHSEYFSDFIKKVTCDPLKSMMMSPRLSAFEGPTGIFPPEGMLANKNIRGSSEVLRISGKRATPLVEKGGVLMKIVQAMIVISVPAIESESKISVSCNWTPNRAKTVN
jgi:hypothetical protein